MRRLEVERQLLLALLAFQNGILDRTSLLSALNAWSQSNSSQPLGPILVDQGTLTAEHLLVLEALVSQFLKRFDGDVAKSLAHISSLDSSLREELRTLVEPDLQASPALVGQSVDPYATIAPSDKAGVGDTTSAGTRFRILRPHARGGLGEVFVAEDGELHREVALKQIQSRHADDASSRSRFLLEAEITGGLEHPSIVPVYGLGTYADGRPFYAMRFIRGDSLQEAVARYHDPGRKLDDMTRRLAFRKLLGRFIDVCNAIDYAHSRGVLHRDLKPGNIMLGKYGETLVVDWGLAKLFGAKNSEPEASATRSLDVETRLQPSSASGGAPTVHGSAIGTPGYMSPEQAAGRIDELTPVSDVYSLGATLYHLLTDRSPFTGGDLGEILRRIQRGEFSPPRQIKVDVPKPLEALCLKAMALRPADRYPSARALADDVEHWLADEPVTAGRESMVDRVRRWSRKHRALVGSAAAALVVVAAVAVAAALAINESRRSESAARQDAETQRNAAVINAAEADRQRKSAELSARLADHQRNLALETLKTMIIDVQDQLDNRPDMHDLKRKILDMASANLTKVNAPMSDKTQVDQSWTVEGLSASALMNTGDILVTLGATAEAEKLYRDAAQTFAALVAAKPANVGAKRNLSIAYERLGDVATQHGDVIAARKFYDQGLEISRTLAEAAPADARAQADLSASLSKLGDVSAQQGDLKAAREFYEQDLKISRKLAESAPDEASAQRNLSLSYDQLGDVTIRQGDVRAARMYYEQSLDIRRKLAAADPLGVLAQGDLALSFERLGEVAKQQGDAGAARGFHEQGLEIRRKLVAADPDDVSARRNLSVSLNKLGDVLLQQGDVKTARGLYEQGLDIFQRLAEADPTNARAERELSVSFNKLGDVALQTDEFATARKFYEQGLAIRRKLVTADPTDARAQRDLSISLDKLGSVTVEQGDPAAARKFYDENLEIRRRLVATDPTDALAERDLASAYVTLGNVTAQQGELPVARGHYEQSLEIRRTLAEADPTDAGAQRDLSNSYMTLGAVTAQQGDVDAARRFYVQSMEIRLKLAEADPKSADAQRDLMVSCHDIGGLMQRNKKYTEAINAYRVGVAILEEMIAAEMLLEKSKRELATLKKLIAECEMSLKAPPPKLPARTEPE